VARIKNVKKFFYIYGTKYTVDFCAALQCKKYSHLAAEIKQISANKKMRI